MIYHRGRGSYGSLHIHRDLLNCYFNPCGPNQCRVSEISQIYTKEGWLCLAAVMDLYSRKIIGRAMEKRLTKDLVIKRCKW